MLSDSQIERWSRQILLPDVGGRGQVRLLAARIACTGSGPVADGACDLLARAGVTVVCDDAPGAPDLLVDLAAQVPTRATLARRALAAGVPLVRGRLAGAAGLVQTLVGRPCGLCAADLVAASPHGGALAAPAAQALAALVAAEVLAALLAPPPHGREQRFDLVGGDFAGTALEDIGCETCGGRA